MLEESFLSDEENPLFKEKSYEIKNYKELYTKFNSLNPFHTKKKYSLGQKILDQFQYCQEIKKRKDFKDLWLKMSDLVNNPEEIFVYMHTNDFGKNYKKLYKKWINYYISKTEFILSYQLINLIKKDFKKKFIDEITNSLEKKLTNKLCLFYKRNNHVSVSYGIGDAFEKEDEGIREEDFENIKKVDIKKRINLVESEIFSTSNISLSNKKCSTAKKSKREILNKKKRRINKKRFSDLINKNTNDIYIGREYRAENIEKIKLLVYEYEYYKVKYKYEDYRNKLLGNYRSRNSENNENLFNSGFLGINEYVNYKNTPVKKKVDEDLEFWIKKRNREKFENIILERKIVRINSKSQRSNVSKRSSKIKKRKKKKILAETKKYENVKLNFDFEECKDSNNFSNESTKINFENFDKFEIKGFSDLNLNLNQNFSDFNTNSNPNFSENNLFQNISDFANNFNQGNSEINNNFLNNRFDSDAFNYLIGNYKQKEKKLLKKNKKVDFKNKTDIIRELPRVGEEENMRPSNN